MLSFFCVRFFSMDCHCMQASQCVGDTSISSGSELKHFSLTYGHLAAKRQIGFGSIGDVTSPLRTILFMCVWISGTGIADKSACVYGCSGFLNNSSAGAFPTILPIYITAISSAKWLTTERSCVIKIYVRPPFPVYPPLDSGSAPESKHPGQKQVHRIQ